MQNNSFTLLALGDVVGDAGTEAVCRRMISLKKEYGADFVIVNAENSAETYGMSREAANALLDAGADVLTGGNHSLKNISSVIGNVKYRLNLENMKAFQM